VQSIVLSSITSREFDRRRKKLAIRDGTHNCLNEYIKQEFSVSWTWGTLWVELNTEVRSVDVANTLIAAIVGVHEEFSPLTGQCGRIHSETMILGRNVTFSS
jgi:hypothetical protein